MPEQLFYNTGIATYVWVLSNRKERKRKGKVQLINATGFWVPMRRSLGDKRREISAEQIQQITGLFMEFKEGEHCKIFDSTDFGYRKITIERPLRLNFQASSERLVRLKDESAFQNLVVSKKKQAKEKAKEEAEGKKTQDAILTMLGKLPTTLFKVRPSFETALDRAATGLKLTAPICKAILSALSERDETAEICRDKDGNPEPDPELRDIENVPLKEDIQVYFAREVTPHVPDLPAPRPKPGEFCIYALKCADDSFYIGQTDNFPRRLSEHEAKQVSWTAPRLPVEPIHWEIFETREGAVQREDELKTGFGRQWLKREFAAVRLAAASRQAGAWINTAIVDHKDGKVGKVGYEINFNRYFYQYQPPRELEAIEADIKGIEKDILNMLREVTS